MRRFVPLLFPIFFILGLKPDPGWAAKKNAVFQSPPARLIGVSNVSYSENAPGTFSVKGTLQNPTPEPREVVMRGQLTFYDQTAPKGDLPLFSLRKDTTLVLKPNESREVEVSLINEGAVPRGALRIESMIRIRRQRIWNY